MNSWFALFNKLCLSAPQLLQLYRPGTPFPLLSFVWILLLAMRPSRNHFCGPSQISPVKIIFGPLSSTTSSSSLDISCSNPDTRRESAKSVTVSASRTACTAFRAQELISMENQLLTDTCWIHCLEVTAGFLNQVILSYSSSYWAGTCSYIWASCLKQKQKQKSITSISQRFINTFPTVRLLFYQVEVRAHEQSGKNKEDLPSQKSGNPLSATPSWQQEADAMAGNKRFPTV